MSVRLVSDNPELEQDLPPLDPDGAEGELEAEIDLTDFVDSFDKEPAVDMEEDSLAELDVGIAIQEAEDDGGGDDRSELVLDIAELLAVADDEGAGDDETGPPSFEPGLDIDDLPEVAADTEETSDELLEGVVSEDLPSLDADEEGEATLDDGWSGPDAALDEPLPPRAAEPWSLRVLIAQERIDALVVERGLVVAAGASIHCLGREARRIVPRASVLSVALVGGLLLYFTAAGQLVRQELDAGSGEALDGWRQVAQLKTSRAVSLELGGGGLEPGVVLAKTSHGRLLRSVDRGASFAAEDLHAHVLAFDAREVPSVALVETSAGRSLIVSTDGGSSWRALSLDAVAQRIAAGASPMVAAASDVIVIADAERGLAVSTDAGQSFVRVLGAARATALAIGGVARELSVWVALHNETDDRTAIACIDLGSRTAAIVADIDQAIVGSSAEGARIDALAWDGGGRRLLAAGGFGLVELTSPHRLA